jgi:hypothetical protein
MTQNQAREVALREIKESIRKIKTAGYHLGKASLAGEESMARSRPPRGQVQICPGRLAGAAKTKPCQVLSMRNLHQDATGPPHHTQVTHPCGVNVLSN